MPSPEQALEWIKKKKKRKKVIQSLVLKEFPDKQRGLNSTGNQRYEQIAQAMQRMLQK